MFIMYLMSVLLSSRAIMRSNLERNERKIMSVFYLSRVMWQSNDIDSTYLIFSRSAPHILLPIERFSATVVPYSCGTTQSAMSLASSYNFSRVEVSPRGGLCSILYCKRRRVVVGQSLDSAQRTKCRDHQTLTQNERCRVHLEFGKGQRRPYPRRTSECKETSNAPSTRVGFRPCTASRR